MIIRFHPISKIKRLNEISRARDVARFKIRLWMYSRTIAWNKGFVPPISKSLEEWNKLLEAYHDSVLRVTSIPRWTGFDFATKPDQTFVT